MIDRRVTEEVLGGGSLRECVDPRMCPESSQGGPTSVDSSISVQVTVDNKDSRTRYGPPTWDPLNVGVGAERLSLVRETLRIRRLNS